MKSSAVPLHVPIALLIMLPFCCLAQSVLLGTNRIGVTFADTSLSSDQRSFMLTDIQRCLDAWGATAEIRWHSHSGTNGHVYIPDKNPYFRDGIAFPESLVSNVVSGISLSIPKPLSSAYLDAFVFAQANQEKVQAASDFVDFVNSTNFLPNATNTIQNYFIHPGFTSANYVESAQDLATGFKRLHYHHPSILGFYFSNRGPEPANLWVNLPYSSTGSGGIDWDSYRAVWHDGRWKFSFWIYEDE